ncbi:unnamed protein product [Victoria cruziana]
MTIVLPGSRLPQDSLFQPHRAFYCIFLHSLLYLPSFCKLLKRGTSTGIDVEGALTSHFIVCTLIEGLRMVIQLREVLAPLLVKVAKKTA